MVLSRDIAALGIYPAVDPLDSTSRQIDPNVVGEDHYRTTRFRTADAVNLQKLILCGITAHPPQEGIAKTALGAEETVPWEYHTDALIPLRMLRAWSGAGGARQVTH